jgi:hypothetical protein
MQTRNQNNRYAYRDYHHSSRNFQNTDSNSRIGWDMSAQQKEDYGWVWARKKLETPTKKLLFEGNEVYKNNDILNKNYDKFSPIFANKNNNNNANNHNPFSVFSGDVKKNYDNVFINNLNNNNPYQSKPNITLNNFKPGGSCFTNPVPNNNVPHTNTNPNNFPVNFKIIKAEEYIKNSFEYININVVSLL